MATIGVFCHGGAFRGAYCNGFMRALADDGIVIDQLVGISAGFYACFAHAAGVNHRDFWSERLDSPIFTDPYYRFNVFRRFVDHYTPRVLAASPYSEAEILRRMKNVSAVATRAWGGAHERLSNFESIAEIDEATMATGSLPWFLASFPHRFRGRRYVDGGFGECDKWSFLETDVKVLLVPSSAAGTDDPGYVGRHRYIYVNDYPDLVRTFAWGKPDDYRYIWDRGYDDALKFLRELRVGCEV